MEFRGDLETKSSILNRTGLGNIEAKVEGKGLPIGGPARVASKGLVIVENGEWPCTSSGSLNHAKAQDCKPKIASSNSTRENSGSPDRGLSSTGGPLRLRGGGLRGGGLGGFGFSSVAVSGNGKEWLCVKCGNSNGTDLLFCSRCLREKPSKVSGFSTKGGDPMWRCPVCFGANYAHERTCGTNGCNTQRPLGDSRVLREFSETLESVSKKPSMKSASTHTAKSVPAPALSGILGATHAHTAQNGGETGGLESREINNLHREFSMGHRDSPPPPWAPENIRVSRRGRNGRGWPHGEDINKSVNMGSGAAVVGGEKGRGGWTCERCGNFNFERRMVCNIRSCRAPRPGAMGGGLRGGGLLGGEGGAGGGGAEERRGWTCEECGNFNYESRKVCNIRACRAPKPSSPPLASPPPSASPPPNSSEHTRGGWDCPRCGNFNFDTRNVCNMRKCRAPRPRGANAQSVGPATAIGGNGGGGKAGWSCPECGNFNFSTRRLCNRRACRAPRPPNVRMWKRKPPPARPTPSVNPPRRRRSPIPPPLPANASGGRWVWQEGPPPPVGASRQVDPRATGRMSGPWTSDDIYGAGAQRASLFMGGPSTNGASGNEEKRDTQWGGGLRGGSLTGGLGRGGYGGDFGLSLSGTSLGADRRGLFDQKIGGSLSLI